MLKREKKKNCSAVSPEIHTLPLYLLDNKPHMSNPFLSWFKRGLNFFKKMGVQNVTRNFECLKSSKITWIEKMYKEMNGCIKF